MRQKYTWMQKKNIYLNDCPTNSKELKNFVMEKFRKHVWGKELGRKKKYYIEEFNPTYDLQQKEYIGANIPWRAKVFIAQLRTNSFQLWCEQDDGKCLKKLGKNECVHFARPGQWNQKKISFWNVMRSKTSKKVIGIS